MPLLLLDYFVIMKIFFMAESFATDIILQAVGFVLINGLVIFPHK